MAEPTPRNPLLILRTTREELSEHAAINDLYQGEPYLFTEEPGFALGTSTNTFVEVVRNDGGVSGIKVLTQAEYDALDPPNSTVLYFISD